MPRRCGGQTLDVGAQAGPEAETEGCEHRAAVQATPSTTPLLAQGPKACAAPVTHGFLLGGGTGPLAGKCPLTLCARRLKLCSERVPSGKCTGTNELNHGKVLRNKEDVGEDST